MKRYLLFIPLFLLIACTTVEKQTLTLGLVQKEVKVGMSQADVAKALGSPNMATKDKDGMEAWIYDKVSRDSASTSSGFGVIFYGQSNESSSQTQRTLTVIIKFADSVVKEFTYNATSF